MDASDMRRARRKSKSRERLKLFADWVRIRSQWLMAAWVPLGDVHHGEVVLFPRYLGKPRMLVRGAVWAQSAERDRIVIQLDPVVIHCDGGFGFFSADRLFMVKVIRSTRHHLNGVES